MSKKKMTRMNGKKKKSTKKTSKARGKGDVLAPYYRMLQDPCNAQLVPAPYAGMGSSLLVRTVQVLTPTLTVVGNGALDFVIEASPFNYPSVFRGAIAPYGALATSVVGVLSTGSNTTFLSSVAVREFRPVAACLKWVPNGPISSRSGVIGMSYSPSMTMPLSSVVYTNAANVNMRVAGNGSEQHECLWIPSFADERFTTATEADIAGVGSVRICGQRIDATQVASECVANGYIELTAVYEWTPASSAGANTGVVPCVSTPSAYSLNAVLSRIKDVGKFVFRHAGSMIDLYDSQVRPSYHGNAFITY